MGDPDGIPPELRSYIAGPEDENGERDLFCPLHNDGKRSGSINLRKGVYNCFAGCGGQRVDWLVQQMREQGIGPRSNVVDLGRARQRRRGGEEPPAEVTLAHVHGWHSALLSDKKRLAYLRHERGLSRATIAKYLLGFDGEEEAYTIPVFGAESEILNVRRYRRARAGKRSSYWNVRGMGAVRIFPSASLEEDRRSERVLLCEGEWDTILALQHDYCAVTSTGGAGTFPEDLGPLLDGRDVYICYDADEAGNTGALRAASRLEDYARGIWLVRLPYAGGDRKDITDYFVLDGHTREDFDRLLEEAEVHKDPTGAPERPEPVDATVSDMLRGGNAERPLRVNALIVGKKDPPYFPVNVVRITCDMDAGSKCQHCPMLAAHGENEVEIEKDESILLSLINIKDDVMRKAIRKIVRAKDCGHIEYDVVKRHTIQQLFLRGNVHDLKPDEDYDHTLHTIHAVYEDRIDPSSVVQVTGRPMPSPKDMRADFLAYDITRQDTSIDTFHVTPEFVERSKMFRPKRGQSPLKRMGEIAADLSANVTQIAHRPAMHIAMDMVFHSLLSFHFNGEFIDKGWLDILIIGDTRTGKSKAAKALCTHYSLGRVVSCEGASFAGIVGGLQQIGSEWTVTWGEVPMNDRRLVVLDEVTGLSTEQISQMSSIRSSGIAELHKIRQEQVAARTRLIWMGNPRKGKLETYLHAVKAIKEMIGNDEDIARFDFAMAVTSSEVTAEEINTSDRETAEHWVTKEAANDLVLWAWTRTKDQVHFEAAAVQEVLEQSVALSEEYVEDPPLIQGANIRVKLAKMAAAIAARTFSSDETGEMVIVRRPHVTSAVRFLNWVYGQPSFGYQDRSTYRKEDLRAANMNHEETRKYLDTRKDLARFLRDKNDFTRRNIEHSLNMDGGAAGSIIAKLINLRAIREGEGEQFVMEKPLIDILRRLSYDE